MSNPAPDADAVPRCPACELRLQGLPLAARFCPWCGEELPARRLFAQPIPDHSSLLHRMGALRAFLREHLGDEHQDADSALGLDQMHSLMLLGYSNAMLHLGWRYENGSGVARNRHEAERCYGKSARLGNPFARAWLADQQITFTPLEGEPPVPAIQTDTSEQPS